MLKDREKDEKNKEIKGEKTKSVEAYLPICSRLSGKIMEKKAGSVSRPGNELFFSFFYRNFSEFFEQFAKFQS